MQGRVRPAYYAFKLLSLIKGRRLAISGVSSDVKAFAAQNGAQINVVIWNFPPRGHGESREVALSFLANKTGQFRVTHLNAAAYSSQLELEREGELSERQAQPLNLTLRPFEIRWISMP